MASSDSNKELEIQLTEAGNKLLLSSSSVLQLISSLDRVESLLTRVEQSPSESMRKALSTSMKTLIGNELFRHSDIDVRVAVASCISEITRITAPETPYDDDRMKEVFQLIVSSFEKLDDQSSPSYVKRTSILETVAKVRSCVVMLDLECDALIAEMFLHFFESIRSEHPENVFSSMETIMTLVLEESEDVSVDLVSVILDVLKIENKEVLPVARQLGEKVFEKCISKIEPCLEKAMKTLNTTKDDYPKVVANVLKEGSEATETRDAEAASKNVIASETMDAPPPDVVSNGIIQKESENTSGDNKNAEDANNEPHGEEEPEKTMVKNSDAEEPIKSRSKQGKVRKGRNRKRNSRTYSSEPSEPPITDEKEGIAMPELHEKDDNKDDNTQNDSPAVDTALPAETEKEVEENTSKKVESGEKQEELVDDMAADDVELKESDVKESTEDASVSEPVSHKRTGKKDKEDRAPSSADVVKKGDEKLSELDAKPARKSGKKVQIGSQREDRKKRGQGKVTPPTKDLAKSPVKDEGKKSADSLKSAKDESDVEKASKSNSKRKRSNDNEKESSKYSEELVGSKVKVWWPDDKAFYAGVIEHFDPSSGRHKITYSDGDVEILNLEDEKWKFIDGSASDQGHSTDGENPDETAETPKPKKAKANLIGTKQGKTEASAKKGGTSSSKSKASFKSQSKQKENNKSGGKTKDATPKSVGKSEETKGGKTKDTKSSNTTPKSVGKSKENEVESSKGSNKSKQETLKEVMKSKVKSPKSGSKSNNNSKAKASPLAKEEEDDEENESSPEPVKAPENSKSKSKSGSKSQKSSNKRKRSTKG